jgi:DNA-binding NarL/FixJ family response regulator
MRGHILRILLADDHPVFVAGVRRVLELDGGFEVVAEVHSGPEVLPMVARTQPDVVLLDVRMPGLDGLTGLDRLRIGHPDVHVVMCSMGSDPEQIQSAFARGASGYIVKSVDPNEFASAIRQAVEGTAFGAEGLPGTGEDNAALAAGLTTREIQIMEAVARGLANKAIAKELWVTEQTVKFHLSNIYRKLELSNRTELARWAFSHGLNSVGRAT